MVLGFVMELKVRVLISLRRPEWRSDSLVSVGLASRLVVRSKGQVLRPPISWYASVHNISGALCPSMA